MARVGLDGEGWARWRVPFSQVTRTLSLRVRLRAHCVRVFVDNLFIISRIGR